MKPVLLERKSDTEYRIYILSTLLQEIERDWDGDLFDIEVLGESLQEDWGYDNPTYDDYRFRFVSFEDVEQAKKFARFVQRVLLACLDKSESKVTAESALLDF